MPIVQLVRGFASQHTELRRRRGTHRALCIGRFAGCPSQARLETQELKQQLAATIVHHRPPTNNPLQRPLMRTSQHYPATSYSAHARTHARARACEDEAGFVHAHAAAKRAQPHAPAVTLASTACASASAALRCSTAWSVNGDRGRWGRVRSTYGCGAAQDVAQAKRLQEELTEALKKNVRCSNRPVPSEAVTRRPAPFGSRRVRASVRARACALGWTHGGWSRDGTGRGRERRRLLARAYRRHTPQGAL